MKPRTFEVGSAYCGDDKKIYKVIAKHHSEIGLDDRIVFAGSIVADLYKDDDGDEEAMFVTDDAKVIVISSDDEV